MKQLPLTVISGYLGAGKTTLINRLLTADHGLRLAVLVNDFGKINIDATLLKSARDDTIELTNGCVCCTMSGDLFFAIGDMLDRAQRPDHLIIEASGIADPTKIADVAIAEPDLRYAGIVTVADCLNLPGFLANDSIHNQVKQQLRAADLVVLSKANAHTGPAQSALQTQGIEHWVRADDESALNAFLFANVVSPKPKAGRTIVHPDYVQWSDAAPRILTEAEIKDRLRRLPFGLLRFKAIVPAPHGHSWEIHCVGTTTSISQIDATAQHGVVAIGLGMAVTQETLASWWNGSE